MTDATTMGSAHAALSPPARRKHIAYRTSAAPIQDGPALVARFWFDLVRDGVTTGGGFVDASGEAAAIHHARCMLAGGADVVLRPSGSTRTGSAA